MTVLDIIPNQGVDKGGNDVHVRGHNFPSSTSNTYKCMFGTDIVDGIWVARSHVICPAPKHSEGRVTLEISVDGIEYTNNKVFDFSIVFFCFKTTKEKNLISTFLLVDISFYFKVTFIFKQVKKTLYLAFLFLLLLLLRKSNSLFSVDV